MRYYGKIGFEKTVEDPVGSGVWIPQIVEKRYYGEAKSIRYKRDVSDKVNDDITLNVSISILADVYAQYNFNSIIYAEYMGTRWKVIDIDPAYPRLRLTLGGEYNGEKQA